MAEGEQNVTVRLIERTPRLAFRHDPRWLPWSWIAFDQANQLLATGRDRATRAECLSDVNLLFGSGAEVAVVEKGAPARPLRRAVTA